jgi:hypothetical protein
MFYYTMYDETRLEAGSLIGQLQERKKVAEKELSR